MLFLLVNKQVQAAYSIERGRTAYKNLSIYLYNTVLLVGYEALDSYSNVAIV